MIMEDETQEYTAPHRQIESETVWLIIIGLIGIVVAAWYFIHQHQTQAREKHAAEIRQQQTDACIAALALKYNAVTNWEVSLPDRDGAQPFSIDISRALIRSESGRGDSLGIETKPVLIKCNVNDIFEKNGKIIASLLSADTANSLSLELQCSPAQVITLASTNQLLSFAVVFKCQEVKRLSGDGEGFFIKGELLDAVQLPEHFVSQDTSNQQDEYDPGDAQW
jgi:hypothetical protein